MFLTDKEKIYYRPLLLTAVLNAYVILMLATGRWHAASLTWLFWIDWFALSCFGLLKVLYLIFLGGGYEGLRAAGHGKAGWRVASLVSGLKRGAGASFTILSYLLCVTLWLSFTGYLWLSRFPAAPRSRDMYLPVIYIFAMRAYNFFAHFIRQDAAKTCPADIIAETLVRFLSLILGMVALLAVYILLGWLLVPFLPLLKLLPDNILKYTMLYLLLLAWNGADVVIMVWGKIKE